MHVFRDLTVAAVLVGIILLFIVCHSFKFIVNVYEAYLMDAGKDFLLLLTISALKLKGNMNEHIEPLTMPNAYQN